MMAQRRLGSRYDGFDFGQQTGFFTSFAEPLKVECNQMLQYDDTLKLHFALQRLFGKSEEPSKRDDVCRMMDQYQEPAYPTYREPVKPMAAVAQTHTSLTKSPAAWLSKEDFTVRKGQDTKLQDQVNPSLRDIPLPKFAKGSKPQDECRNRSETSNDELPDGCEVYPEGIFKVDAAVQPGQDVKRRVVRDSSPPTPPDYADETTGTSAMIFDGIFASVGTIGHPTNCAEACKYFRKARSCRQGQLCTRCHLCKRRHLGRWRRPRVDFCKDFGVGEDYGSEDDSPKVQEVGVDTQDLELALLQSGGNAPSIGSVGHPQNCGPACRYVWRKGGCTNGKDCYCCHLCNWSRLS
jgi:hypothetical protein|mmetsp:Transcript_65865/g.102819  ORF Transcript_65865/g.102819 Transcript_65865/m.102819 type:complete len:350 (-) Transcript_65865:236-1285(-)